MLTIKSSNVTVMVKNMDDSIRFYESIGLKLRQRWENNYAMMEAADIVLGLHPSSESIPPSSQVSIGFMVEKIAEAKMHLDGVHLSYKAEEGKSGSYLHLRDPDGTYLYFVEPKWR
ncbi:MAG TPA: VOC family protein [Bacteroidota bacterium]|nr:VOC family protein [Bacteroidota bacterium]